MSALRIVLGLVLVASVGCDGAARVGDGGSGLPAESAVVQLPHDAPDGVSAERIATGKEVFLGDGLCYACHGADGAGARGVGADLTDDEWWHSDGSYPAIAEQIALGVRSEQVRNKLGAVMPPRGGSDLTSKEIEAVAAYVWSLRLR